MFSFFFFFLQETCNTALEAWLSPPHHNPFNKYLLRTQSQVCVRCVDCRKEYYEVPVFRVFLVKEGKE